MADGEWPLHCIKEHFEALRASDFRYFEALRTADQRALRIKEEADNRALALARDIQAYKDERDNRLREQINAERGQYVTHEGVQAMVARIEALIVPLHNYVTAQQGQMQGVTKIGVVLGALITAGIGFLAIVN